MRCGEGLWRFDFSYKFCIILLIQLFTIMNILHGKLPWVNLNLDLCFSRARAFSSGGILEDKRENNRGNNFIQAMLSILYGS